MKVAVVSHMPWNDPYGAATSLRLTTEALKGHSPELELTVIAHSSRRASTRSGREQSDSRVRDPAVIPVDLPMEIVCHGFSQPAPARRSWNRVVRWRSLGLVERELARVVASSDLIHLNSMTLVWVAGALQSILGSDCPPITLHLRESALPVLAEPTRQDFSRLAGIVAIDDNVRTRLLATLPNICCPMIVLPNLVPQPAVSPLDGFKDGLRERIDGRPVVAVTGRISPDKGIDFASSAVAGVGQYAPVLVVVGATSRSKWLSPQSHREIRRAERRLSAGSLIYLGEVPGLGYRGFYRHVDVLIRGDARPGIGRNVYEALRSGSSVIVPGAPGDYASTAMLSEYSGRVYFARVRDRAAYSSAIFRALRDRSERVSGGEDAANLGLPSDAHHAEVLLSFWKSVTEGPRAAE